MSGVLAGKIPQVSLSIMMILPFMGTPLRATATIGSFLLIICSSLCIIFVNELPTNNVVRNKKSFCARIKVRIGHIFILHIVSLCIHFRRRSGCLQKNSFLGSRVRPTEFAAANEAQFRRKIVQLLRLCNLVILFIDLVRNLHRWWRSIRTERF